MIDLAIKNQIHLLCLPPHTTHRLQPLDVGIFGPMQKAWYWHAELYTAKYGTSIAQQHVVKEYWEDYKSAFITNTVLQAWCKCGIYLFNLNAFTATNYAPSVSMLAVNHAPTLYPDN
ncbi:hypothetical protein SERLADRAFT_440684 [Serpula lacrymans var. lacrymans S7.9]|uniref:DDE-1 domain-containing protein n=2 Tax=Serpula lacrymans var. lacrymans TaxID=341189 RepID=F8P3D4_SERL9|nr:uncharacterized protein SERLADRAFT_440684 [Serpula lacrymans var. lacrymans S7.9]EGO22665.1 hypothetical protein SERLADRAFT_440684 [Serpula lacrymans var. lacrymans S7.9]